MSVLAVSNGQTSSWYWKTRSLVQGSFIDFDQMSEPVFIFQPRWLRRK